MAVKAKTSEAPQGANLRAAILAQCSELLDRHINGIMAFLDESEDKCEKVTFGVAINCSESTPQIDVAIRYSQSVTDSRSAVLDDPNQGTFRPLVEAAEEETAEMRAANLDALRAEGVDPDTTKAPEPAKKRGRKKRGELAAAPEAPEATEPGEPADPAETPINGEGIPA